ncbi:hypothetical protein CB1_000377002 [Camelus ferus]|nr:hypothetical protein CB1_000377002 [Camelus ferus]
MRVGLLLPERPLKGHIRQRLAGPGAARSAGVEAFQRLCGEEANLCGSCAPPSCACPAPSLATSNEVPLTWCQVRSSWHWRPVTPTAFLPDRPHPAFDSHFKS